MGNLITKKTLSWAVVIVVAGWLIVSAFSKPADKETGYTATQTATSSKTVATTTTTATAPKKTTTPVASQPVTMSYQKALENYKDNLRIQLSGTSFCQASPNNVMYKSGTSIMIDNRSAQTRNIKIGSASYTIEGYGFKIVKLSSATLPTTLLMDCGTQQNIAKILLQK